MANHTHNNSKSAFRRAAYIAAALFVLIALTAGVIYARYAMGIGGKGSLTSPDFYFSSDLLFQSPGTYTLNQGQHGTTSFTFKVRNYVDALRINKKAIDITISVAPSDGVVIYVNGVVGNEITIPADGTKQDVTVTVSGLKNGKSYTISATGSAGFKQTISAMVNVKPDEPNIYMHLNDADDYYVLLTVWTKNLEGDVIITYPAGLIPDATDPAMATGVDFATRTFTDAANNFKNAYSSHVYRFFKNTPGNNFDIAAFVDKVVLDPSDPADDSVKATPAIPE